jgi:hypothetical protein
MIDPRKRYDQAPENVTIAPENVMIHPKKPQISAPLRTLNLELKIKKLRKGGAVDNMPAFDTHRIVVGQEGESDSPAG